MSSKTDKRAKEILRLLLSHGKTSVEELTERIALMNSEIERLQVAMSKKRASKDAANSFFKT